MFNFYKDNGSNEFKSVALDGKYLILTANESEYDKLTLSDVRDNIEAIRELQSIENDAATEEDEEGDYEIDTTEVRFEE